MTLVPDRIKTSQLPDVAEPTQHRRTQSLSLTGQQHRRLDALLDEALERFTGPLAQPCARVVRSPGGRLRPALTVACAGLAEGAAEEAQVMALAAAVELLHCATLVHDDVIDDAQTRRGVTTINAALGTSTAIVCGDVLIAAALSLAAGVDGRAAAVMAATLAQLCIGQAAEEDLRFDVAATREQVSAVAAGKTGSLLRAACVLGGMAAGVDDRVLDALGAYGAAFGVCLQMVDDVLDVISSEALLGKPVGADITAGVITFPILAGLADRREFGDWLGAAPRSDEHERALHFMRTGTAVKRTVAAARLHARTAGAELRRQGRPPWPGSPMRQRHTSRRN
jgi:heptaprenyl diphosphate synthase